MSKNSPAPDSQNSSLSNSPGFVYFDNSQSQTSFETSDFMSFNDSPRARYNTKEQGSPYGRSKWPSNNSKQSLHTSEGIRNFRNSRKPYTNTYRFRNQSRTYHNMDDISQYYHPSMTENPWAMLEEQLNQKLADNSEQDSLLSQSTHSQINVSECNVEDGSEESNCKSEKDEETRIQLT